MSIAAAAKTTRPKPTTKKERAGHSPEEWQALTKLLDRLIDAGVPVTLARVMEWAPQELNEVTAWLETVAQGPGHHARLPDVLLGHLPNGWKNPAGTEPVAVVQPKPATKAKPAEPPAAGTREELPIGKLVPSPTNPRKHFNPEALERLAESIKKVGVLEPILVRPHGDKAGYYEIAAGERRYRAAKLAGRKTVPVEIRNLLDEEFLEVQLIENIEREDLNAIEEAIAFKQLLESEVYSEHTLAKRLNLSQGHISNRVRLLKLPENWQQKVISGEITPTDARDLARWAERPAVLEYVEKEMRGGPYREYMVRSAVEKCSRPINGDYYDSKSYRYIPVTLTKKEKAREDLDVEEIKNLGKRAFNLDLWEELQAAGLKRREERKVQSNGQDNGTAERTLTPSEAKRKAEQKDRQWQTKLYRYKVRWLQRQIVDRLGDLDFADHKSEALLLRCGLLLAVRDRVPHGPLVEAIAAAGGNARSDLHGKSAWSALQSIPDDQTMTVMRNLVQAVVQTENLESYNSPIQAAHIEGLAADLGIDVKTDWRLEEEFLGLHTKDSLEALALEWNVTLGGTKRSELIDELLTLAANAKCPKELATLKPQF